jgi:hypothetical protein
VVGPFTTPPARSRVEPDPGTRRTYVDLLERYRALEARHAG